MDTAADASQLSFRICARIAYSAPPRKNAGLDTQEPRVSGSPGDRSEASPYTKPSIAVTNVRARAAGSALAPGLGVSCRNARPVHSSASSVTNVPRRQGGGRRRAPSPVHRLYASILSEHNTLRVTAKYAVRGVAQPLRNVGSLTRFRDQRHRIPHNCSIARRTDALGGNREEPDEPYAPAGSR